MESFNGHFKGESEGLFFDARNMWELRREIAVQMNTTTYRGDTDAGIPGAMDVYQTTGDLATSNTCLSTN